MNMSSKSLMAAGFAENVPVQRFALRVVTELARTSGAKSETPRLELASVLLRYARTGNAALLTSLHAEMLRRRVAAEEIMDLYLPHTVCEIGEDWHEDRIDILQASMAFARLQNLLRELSKAWVSDRVGRNGDGRILLMLPRGEQHALGAMFVAHQLRRLGVSVKVMLTVSPDLMAETLRRNRFHGIFISASNKTSLGPCNDLIRALRACDCPIPPVVVGGGLVSLANGDSEKSRIAAITGADMVTSDMSCALHACGIQQISAAAE